MVAAKHRTDLFAGYMQMPQRTSRGRNAGQVIV
jgi:hypothetical protein